ncbi:MAG: DNA-3-methyladenine glycosylase I [Ferruginibacter sp.]
MKKDLIRCEFVTQGEELIPYHDEEWGKPVLDDNKLFEILSLGGQQAGISWLIVFKKREAYRKLFYKFNIKKVAAMSKDELEVILTDASIIRNSNKINSIVHNAKLVLEIIKESGSFTKYIWEFVNHKAIQNKYKHFHDIPATSILSDNMSADLKKRGFKFTGSIICYSFMQSAGLVNDHSVGCFRYKELIS